MFALCGPQHQGVYFKGNTRKFGPKVTHPSSFERRRHSIANCGRMVTDSATVTMESLKESTIALSNIAIADPQRPPLPPKWRFHMPPRYANDHISATGDPIHFMFGSRVGFQGRRIEWRLFLVTSNPRKISTGRICATAHSIHRYSAHREVIFAIAQLSCYIYDL